MHFFRIYNVYGRSTTTHNFFWVPFVFLPAPKKEEILYNRREYEIILYSWRGGCACTAYRVYLKTHVGGRMCLHGILFCEPSLLSQFGLRAIALLQLLAYIVLISIYSIDIFGTPSTSRHSISIDIQYLYRYIFCSHFY